MVNFEPKGARLKVLVVRFSSFGDVILTTALFPNLKSAWPGCEVTVLTRREYADLFIGNPCVDHILMFDPSRQPFSKLLEEVRTVGFDLCIDLQGNARSYFLRVVGGISRTILVNKSMLARYGLVWFKRVSPALNKTFRERILDCLGPLEIEKKSEETQLFPAHVDGILNSFEIAPGTTLIGLAPGARHATKRWSPEKFAAVGNHLGKKPGSLVLILGDKSDQAQADKVAGLLRVPNKNLVGWTSLREIMAVVSRLSFMVTNDSGLLHMAEALKIPLVTIFGPTVRALGFAPYRESSLLVELPGLDCRPCTLHGGDVCPLQHHRCMEEVSAQMVLERL